MNSRTRYLVFVAFVLAALASAGCGRRDMGGRWTGSYSDGQKRYRVEVNLLKGEGGGYTGVFRVVDKGQVADLQEFKTVTVTGATVECQTDDQGRDGRRLVLKREGGKLVGRLQPTLAEVPQGAGYEITLDRE